MNSFERKCAGLALATLISAYSSFSPAAAEPIVLKLNAVSPNTEETYVTAIKPFIDAVNKEGEGIVKIDAFPSGGLNRSFPQQTQLVLDGVADIAFIIPSLTPGRFSDNGALQLPGIFHDLRELTLVYTHLVAQNKLRGHESFFVIGALGTPPYSVYSRKPIRSLHDLDGMKIAVTSPTNAAVMSAMGAAPVPMPVSEMAEAIGRGTIDGALIFPGPLFDYGTVRVTSHAYLLRFGANPIALIMNRAKFDSLPAKAQEIIRKYSGEWFANKYIEGTKIIHADRQKTLETDPKWKLVAASAEDQRKADTIFKAYNDSWLAKDPANPELFRMVQNEIKKLR